MSEHCNFTVSKCPACGEHYSTRGGVYIMQGGQNGGPDFVQSDELCGGCREKREKMAEQGVLIPQYERRYR